MFPSGPKKSFVTFLFKITLQPLAFDDVYPCVPGPAQKGQAIWCTLRTQNEFNENMRARERDGKNPRTGREPKGY